jgi:hypothetical protein
MGCRPINVLKKVLKALVWFRSSPVSLPACLCRLSLTGVGHDIGFSVHAVRWMNPLAAPKF